MDKTERIKNAILKDTIRVRCAWRGRKAANNGYDNDYYLVGVFDGDEAILTPKDVHEKFRKSFFWSRSKHHREEIIMNGGNYSKPLEIAIEILYALWRESGVEKGFMKRGILPGRYLEEV